jgi:hypothetical protein
MVLMRVRFLFDGQLKKEDRDLLLDIPHIPRKGEHVLFNKITFQVYDVLTVINQEDVAIHIHCYSEY